MVEQKVTNSHIGFQVPDLRDNHILTVKMSIITFVMILISEVKGNVIYQMKSKLPCKKS